MNLFALARTELVKQLNNGALLSTALVDSCVATVCNDHAVSLGRRRTISDLLIREFNYMKLND